MPPSPNSQAEATTALSSSLLVLVKLQLSPAQIGTSKFARGGQLAGARTAIGHVTGSLPPSASVTTSVTW